MKLKIFQLLTTVVNTLIKFKKLKPFSRTITLPNKLIKFKIYLLK